MRSIEDQRLVDSLADDIVVFWRLGDRRRVLVTRDYTQTIRHLTRLLRHFGASSATRAPRGHANPERCWRDLKDDPVRGPSNSRRSCVPRSARAP
jgi:hypothetical protein